MSDEEVLEQAKRDAAALGMTLQQYAEWLCDIHCAAIRARRAELAAGKAA